MRRAFPVFCIAIATLWSLSAQAEAPPAGTETSEAKAAAAPSEQLPAAPSPWEHRLWHDATTAMRLYLCDHARRPPSWCGGPRELPAKAALPEPHGPPLIEEDAAWLAFLEEVQPGELSAQDVERVRRRAVERRDPQAMEILGFLHAEGLSVERDYAEAYRWYGMAYLSGEKRVRPNMDVVWQLLQRHDLEAALALTREFDALAKGEVPPGLKQAPAAESPAAATP
jgi:TPR repeat protein